MMDERQTMEQALSNIVKHEEDTSSEITSNLK